MARLNKVNTLGGFSRTSGMMLILYNIETTDIREQVAVVTD
jgi:hypothetical protein